VHASNLGGDPENRIHLDHIWPVIKRTNDVASLDVGVVEQRHELLALQLDGWAVVVHVAHHQQLVANAMPLEPLLRHCAIHDRACREDDDVAARVDVQIVVVRIVEWRQRMVVVVAVERVLGLPIDLGDAPLVVGDAVVDVENDHTHDRSPISMTNAQRTMVKV